MGRRLPAPTKEQQGHLRAKLMLTAGTVIKQMADYVTTGEIQLADKPATTMTNERLNTYKLILSKVMPDMHHSEVQHTNKYENVSSDELIGKLAAMAQERPQLAKRLNEVIGGKVIEGETVKDCK